MSVILTLEQAQALADDPQGDRQLKHWAYNALDVTGTREIADVLLPRLTADTEHIYKFERAQQNPAFAMMVRGVRVDVVKRAKAVAELKAELKKDLRTVAKMDVIWKVWDQTEKETGFCPARIGKHHKWPRGVPDEERSCELCHAPRIKPKPFNPNSQDQVDHLLYELLGVKVMYNKKHERSVDEDVLERMAIRYPQHKTIIAAILAVRNKKKQIGSLNAKLSPTNRYHSSFNPGTAWTGRFSSNQNPYRWGGNLQNVPERHRHVFVADPGYRIGYADLKTAESMKVAYTAGDENYIKAHKEGDVHTFVARLVWPDLPWNGDIFKDKKIAKSMFPPWDNVPGHDYRFQSKSVQHGSNLGLTPRGIALQKHIPLKQAEEAQGAYFHAFPYIRGYQEWIGGRVVNHLPLSNALGRTITLFGRPWDNHTKNQGLAFPPQSGVADILNLGMWRVWWAMDPWELELLAQVHDALLFQILIEKLHHVNAMGRLMTIPTEVTDYRGNKRIMTIPVEMAIGDNWGHKSKDNPYGIEEIELEM